MIVVYPMNALANSQHQELTKFLSFSFPDGHGPVTPVKEKDEERQAIVADPPDILLTNYVMLELILTRIDERELVNAAKGPGPATATGPRGTAARRPRPRPPSRRTAPASSSGTGR